MLHNTRGIILRSVKYGETSLVVTVFTEHSGVEAYMVKGVRTANAKRTRAGALQPGTLLDLVTYAQPQKEMQYLRDFQPAYIYKTVQENVIRNSILLFSVEVLLRLLPARAEQSILFDFAFGYFVALDQYPDDAIANFPLYFVVQCSKIMGYELKGNFSEETPYINPREGQYTSEPPTTGSTVNTEDAKLLSEVLCTEDVKLLQAIEMNSGARLRLTEWYISFLQEHTQHMGNVRSLAVLSAILH